MPLAEKQEHDEHEEEEEEEEEEEAERDGELNVVRMVFVAISSLRAIFLGERGTILIF